MAENIPPAGEGARGQPYYEKLKRDLRETLQKKRVLDRNLATVEDQIFRQETAYLEDTSAGNIIKGFDNYIKGASSSAMAPAGAAGRKKSVVQDSERIFSRSSASFMRESSPDSLSQTPSHAPTPTSGTGPRDSNAPTPTSAVGNKAGSTLKRNKKGEKDEDDSESKPPKRLKITYSRGDKTAD